MKLAGIIYQRRYTVIQRRWAMVTGSEANKLKHLLTLPAGRGRYSVNWCIASMMVTMEWTIEELA